MDAVPSHFRERLAYLALSAAVKAADISLHVPPIRNFFLNRLLERLSASHETCEAICSDDFLDLRIDEGPRRFESLVRRYEGLLDEGAERIVVDRTNPWRWQRGTGA